MRTRYPFRLQKRPSIGISVDSCIVPEEDTMALIAIRQNKLARRITDVLDGKQQDALDAGAMVYHARIKRT